MIKHAYLLILLIAAWPQSCKKLVADDELQPGSVASVPAPAPVVPEMIYAQNISSRIDSVFQKLHKNNNFNGAVLVARNGFVLYENAFGYGNFQEKTPLTVNTPFQLASVSKQFTAAAIMLLEEQGKLRYTDSLRHFFPELPYNDITIKHLLTHRSGLPNYMYFCDIYYKDHNTPITNSDLVSVMADSCPRIYYHPDKRHNYSNTGYSLLAAIVEKISGKPFEKFMEENIFKPLNMQNTFVYNKAVNPQLPAGAVGYDKRGHRIANDYMNGITGDKGVYTTVEDMLKWDQALYSEKMFEKETLEEAFSPANPEVRGPVNYGYGWRMTMMNETDKIVFHTGWWRGFKTFYMRDLSSKIMIVVLSNKENWYLNDINGVFDVLYDGQISSARFARVR